MNRSSGNIGSTSGKINKSSDMDEKIDWLVKILREIRDEMACKKEIKAMIEETVREELRNIRQEFEELRKNMRGEIKGTTGNVPKSYCEVVTEKKKESALIVKPKKQQESEATKIEMKEKVDIKNLGVGITKLRKGNKGTIILGCENEGEMEKLKTTVQDKLG